MRTKRGFTLVELAIVLVIIGLLIGAGAGLMNVLVKRAKYNESKEIINAVAEAITSQVASSGLLPDSSGFNSVAPSKKDSYGKDLVYVYDTTLPSSNICGVSSSSISVEVCPDAGCSTPTQTVNNVAFLIISSGHNKNIQTSTSTTSTIRVYTYGVPNIDDNTSDMNRPEEYDDIVKWVTVDELKSARKCEGLVITSPTTLPPAEEDAGYSYKLEASGGVPPYSWSGSIGSGLSLASNGVISGVANTNTGSTGVVSGCSSNISFTATVSDSAGQTRNQTFNIPVNARPVEIITNSLPTASEGASYSAKLSSIGGDGNYTYSIVSGSLPPGLSLNSSTGEISGTVSISDTGCSESGNVFNFVVQVSSCTTHTKGFSITVRDPDCYTSSSGGGSGGGGSGGGGGGGGGSATASILITNNLSIALTDFQIRVDMTNAISCVGNNFDIKRGGSSVPFCLERASGECITNTSLWDSSYVWIKIPALPPNGSLTLSVVQNSSTGADPPSQIFELYDDFNDGDVSDWGTAGATILPTSLGTSIVLQLLPDSATNFKHIAYPTTQSFSLTEYVAEARIYDSNPAGGLMFHYVDDNNWWGLEHYVGGNRDIFRPYVAGSDKGWVYTRGPVSISSSSWYKVRVDALPNRFRMYINDTLIWDRPVGSSYQVFGYSKVGFVEHKWFGPLYADWIRVRKYALVEPSVSVSCP